MSQMAPRSLTAGVTNNARALQLERPRRHSNQRCVQFYPHVSDGRVVTSPLQPHQDFRALASFWLKGTQTNHANHVHLVVSSLENNHSKHQIFLYLFEIHDTLESLDCRVKKQPGGRWMTVWD